MKRKEGVEEQEMEKAEEAQGIRESWPLGKGKRKTWF